MTRVLLAVMLMFAAERCSAFLALLYPPNAFAIIRFEIDAGEVLLVVNARAGFWYVPQHAPSVEGPWQSSGTIELAVTNGPLELRDWDLVAGGGRFYRVRASESFPP